MCQKQLVRVDWSGGRRCSEIHGRKGLVRLQRLPVYRKQGRARYVGPGLIRKGTFRMKKSPCGIASGLSHVIPACKVPAGSGGNGKQMENYSEGRINEAFNC